jgi:isoleucyl-tRNA synthetase
MPQLAAAVAALDPDEVARALRGGQTVVVSVAGEDHELSNEDLTLALAPLVGYGLEREGSHAVALELALDDELVGAGRAREIVHAVQQCRRDSGLEITDRIALVLGGSEELLNVAHAHEAYVAGETLATSIAYGEQRSDWLASTEIDSLTLKIWLGRS